MVMAHMGYILKLENQWFPKWFAVKTDGEGDQGVKVRGCVSHLFFIF